MEERIMELELRSMGQQQTIEELSEVMYRQQQELDGLKAAVDRLTKKLGDTSLIDDKGPERPPHY